MRAFLHRSCHCFHMLEPLDGLLIDTASLPVTEPPLSLLICGTSALLPYDAATASAGINLLLEEIFVHTIRIHLKSHRSSLSW
jgi:hypothetical protein